MNKFRKKSIAFSLACIMALGLMFVKMENVSATLIEDSAVSRVPVNFTNQSDDVFDGYDSMETTMTGRVGYNYAISLPNDEVIKFGFDPRNTTGEIIDFSGIGSGWKIKIPFLDVEDMCIHRTNGYTFAYVSENNDGIASANSDNIYSISWDSNRMLKYDGAYGEYEIYDNEGRITNITDALDNTTTYEYTNGLISKINYSDGSVVIFERTENEVNIIYEAMDESKIIAILKLIEHDDRLVLNEIVADSSVSFEYVSNTDHGLLLKKFDNGKYARTIEYLNNSDRIDNYSQIYADGETTLATYEYGQYDYISAIIRPNGIDEFSYEKLDNNKLKTSTVKTYNGITGSSTRTVDEFGRTVEYTYPGTVLTIIYENGRIISLKENDNLSTYTYDNNGLLSTSSYPSGETIHYTYTENGGLLRAVSSIKGELIKDESNESTSNYNLSAVSGDTLCVKYEINEEVGATNYVEVNGLSQSSFNCYGFALCKENEYLTPGKPSNVAPENYLSYVLLSYIKSYTESDLDHYGMTWHYSNVYEAIGDSNWKFALRVKNYTDVHYMRYKKESDGGKYWQFKAGPNPVMRLLGSETPATVSWDTYDLPLLSTKYVVKESGFYDSSIAYYMIE